MTKNKKYKKIEIWVDDASVHLMALTDGESILKADRYFDKIDIETGPADKMIENQQHAFVKDYFFKHLLKVG